MSELRWQRDLPDEPGHWAWVKWEGEKLFYGIWEIVGDSRYIERKLRATAWAKIELPPREWAE